VFVKQIGIIGDRIRQDGRLSESAANGSVNPTFSATPVSSMRTFWGLLRSYWTSERWKEAWLLTLAIALLTAAVSKASVWMAEASGELISALVNIHEPFNLDPTWSVLSSAGMLIVLAIVKDGGLVGLRHLLSTSLHRKWRRWLDERFNAALLSVNHAHHHIQQSGSATNGDIPMPDNIDQRIQESIKGMTGGAIGLAMGILSVVMSVLFVGQKLIEMSTEVKGLELFGAYASAFLAFALIAIYVPASTWIAARIGRALEKLTLLMQQTEGSYRGELTTFLRRSFQVAASEAESVQSTIHRSLYSDVDRTWTQLNRFDAAYLSFTAVYNFLAARIIAYLPGLLPYASNSISLKNYITGSELVGSMLHECSWFIHVMPAIANLKANARRVAELACAIETVQQPTIFYRSTGVSEFRYSNQHEMFGLSVKKLELMHKGEASASFLTAANIMFRRGEWTYLSGPSGCGKTSLLKAINGLWPHGRGDIFFPEGVSTMYAAQEVKLPNVSLKQLVCLPDPCKAFPGTLVAAALHRAGLGEFIEHLEHDGRGGTSWDQLLSGGQKQRLVLARILLHRPGILFLDEATGALDPAARIAFHQAIKDHCPGITVISVMHDCEPLDPASGLAFYSGLVEIRNGVAVKHDSGFSTPPATAAPGAADMLKPQPLAQPVFAAE
jgi:ABC-type uncharacterized transport system fused permease/ATPase subunit